MAPPLYMEIPGHPKFVKVGDQGWQRLVIPGSAIEAIVVQYRPTTEPAAGEGNSPPEQTS